MSLFRVLVTGLAVAGAATSWAKESPYTEESRRTDGRDLLSAWSFPDPNAALAFTWSQPDERRDLVFTWWTPAAESPLLFAFSSPEASGDLAFAWSRLDEGRELLFTWSQPLVEPEGTGSAAGEPGR